MPCAFITGIMGQFFRQFAVTIAVSTVISAFNSLTLSPALAALLLRPRRKGVYEALPRVAIALIGGWIGFWISGMWPVVDDQQLPVATNLRSLVDLGRLLGLLITAHWLQIIATLAGALAGWVFGRQLNTLLGASFRLFNIGFDYSAGLYTRAVGGMLRISVLVLVVYGGLLFLTYGGITRTPTGFIPAQDKGYLLVNLQLPDASSVQRTEKVVQQIETIAARTLGVKNRVAVSGQSLLLNVNAPNFGSMYLMLDDFHDRLAPERLLEKKKKLREKERADNAGSSSAGRLTEEEVAAELERDRNFLSKHADLSADAIAERLQEEFDKEIPDAQVHVFGAPPIEGLGTAGGFKIVILDPRAAGTDVLQKTAEKAVSSGKDNSGLQGLFTSFRANTPWLYLDIKRDQAKVMGVSMDEIFNTLQVYLGSLYVNDLTAFDRTWQVNMQADGTFRRDVKDLKRLQVRNDRGGMVPLGSVAELTDISGPVMVMRYNMYPAAAINGSAAPGVSSGQAIRMMEEVVQQDLPPTMRYEWTELAMLQLQTGSTAIWVFAFAVVLVFLVLAAQYESLSLPLAVILVVPMCLLFSVAGVIMARMDINIFTQVGFVVLVGLACKNAILIVEFARARRNRGTPSYEATLEACQLRLRPIMMTSFAFILGVVPLMISEGAGAEMRRTLGTAVFAGMLGVTLFGIFLTPVFYYVIQWLNDKRASAPPLTVMPAGEGNRENED